MRDISWTRIAHQQHQPLRNSQTSAQHKHADGYRGADEPIEPDKVRDAEQREEQHDAGEERGQQVERIGQDACVRQELVQVWQGHAHDATDAAVVAQAVSAYQCADDGG